MSNQRSHYVTTSDGVTIGATVHGQGPPLVFLQGIIGDGDTDWRALVPQLADRFTCHFPSMRGRGLSGDHSDLSLGRVIDDFLNYVDSIGEPAGLVGWSGGANHALGLAAQCDSVTGVAAIEPVANSLMDDRGRAALGEAVARAAELADEGDLTAAMRVFAGFPFSDRDIAAAEDVGYFEKTGRYVPKLLKFFQQMRDFAGPWPDDPGVLRRISTPVTVLHGSHTKPFMTVSAHHVAEHVPDGRMKEIRGAGHAAPLTHPEILAEVLTQLFAEAQQPG